MNDAAPLGRRERKKAATRQAIADAARDLFLESGFDAVTIKQIADRADVSLATVYAHFPQKEALVFDVDDEMRERLLSAVTNRDTGVTIFDALRGWLLGIVEEFHSLKEDDRVAWDRMIQQAPSVQAYERAMWLQNEEALSETITRELGLEPGDYRVRLFAHFILDSWTLVDPEGDPRAVVDAAFALLQPGWDAIEHRSCD